jgi:hypothetical protein
MWVDVKGLRRFWLDVNCGGNEKLG